MLLDYRYLAAGLLIGILLLYGYSSGIMTGTEVTVGSVTIHHYVYGLFLIALGVISLYKFPVASKILVPVSIGVGLMLVLSELPQLLRTVGVLS